MDITQKQSVNGRMVSVIATYRDDDANKDYIIYTDETKDEQGKLNVCYGTYKMDGDKIEVGKVETREEEKKILEVLKFVTKNTETK